MIGWSSTSRTRTLSGGMRAPRRRRVRMSALVTSAFCDYRSGGAYLCHLLPILLRNSLADVLQRQNLLRRGAIRRRRVACRRRRCWPGPGRWCAGRRRRMASRPLAPSRPMPVSSTPVASPCQCRATQSKEHVHRRPVGVVARVRRRSAGAGAASTASGGRWCAATCTTPASSASPSSTTRTGMRQLVAQPLGEVAGEIGVDVLHHHDGGAGRRRSSRPGSCDDRLGPPVEAPIASRCAHGGSPGSAPAGPPAAGRRLLADQLADGLDLGQQGRVAAALAVPGSAWPSRRARRRRARGTPG